MVAAAGGRVVLVVPKSLRRLMTTLDGVTDVLSEDDDVLPAIRLPLPAAEPAVRLRHDHGHDPGGGSVPARRSRPLGDFLAGLPGLKVGLVWAGKSRTAQPHAVAIDKRRSMWLADMAPLLSVPGCSFVSLQLGPPASQMQALPDGVQLHDMSGRMNANAKDAEVIDDWADTAALIAGLDLVIAVDTAVAHLAGALGKPVWMLNRFDSCWRWFLNRDDTPWYPTMRQFRQTRRGDWAGVIERVTLELTRHAAGR